MSILNIKRLPDDLYEKLRALARRQHRSVSQQVIHLLDQALEEPQPLSILDLRGLGKEHWENVDEEAFIAGERRSWD